MKSKHLYNEKGRWIAFIVGSDVYVPSGDLFGCLANRFEVYGTDGRFIGAISHDNRLLWWRKGKSVRICFSNPFPD